MQLMYMVNMDEATDEDKIWRTQVYTVHYIGFEYTMAYSVVNISTEDHICTRVYT